MLLWLVGNMDRVEAAVDRGGDTRECCAASKTLRSILLSSGREHTSCVSCGVKLKKLVEGKDVVDLAVSWGGLGGVLSATLVLPSSGLIIIPPSKGRKQRIRKRRMLNQVLRKSILTILTAW